MYICHTWGPLMRFINKLGIVIPAAGAKVKIQTDPVSILHYRRGETKVTFLERPSEFPASVSYKCTCSSRDWSVIMEYRKVSDHNRILRHGLVVGKRTSI